MTIKEMRQSVNMTQSEFAEWLSTSTENIKNWERGKSQPSEILLKLIDYYVEGHKQGEQINLTNEDQKILKTYNSGNKETVLSFIEPEKIIKNSGYHKYYICKRIEI